jgi:1,4-alpha-glucan branching enzyme
MTSWGYKGYNEVWLNGSNDWLYRHLHLASRRLHELVDGFAQVDGLRERALKQAARELLLAQASDWAFIMKTGTMVEYAVRRSKEHLSRFNRLHGEITSGQIDEAWLADVEQKDNLFPDIDYRAYASRE